MADYDPVYEFLRRGGKYRVKKTFADHDRALHTEGEIWLFHGTTFLPYEDGRSFFVSINGGSEVQVRLQDRDEEQAAILNNLDDYLEAE